MRYIQAILTAILSMVTLSIVWCVAYLHSETSLTVGMIRPCSVFMNGKENLHRKPFLLLLLFSKQKMSCQSLLRTRNGVPIMLNGHLDLACCLYMQMKTPRYDCQALKLYMHYLMDRNFPIKAGPFQATLLLKIFSTHLVDTAGAPKSCLVQAAPCGALTLALAAVRTLSDKLQTAWLTIISG